MLYYYYDYYVGTRGAPSSNNGKFLHFSPPFFLAPLNYRLRGKVWGQENVPNSWFAQMYERIKLTMNDDQPDGAESGQGTSPRKAFFASGTEHGTYTCVFGFSQQRLKPETDEIRGFCQCIKRHKKSAICRASHRQPISQEIWQFCFTSVCVCVGRKEIAKALIIGTHTGIWYKNYGEGT